MPRSMSAQNMATGARQEGQRSLVGQVMYVCAYAFKQIIVVMI